MVDSIIRCSQGPSVNRNELVLQEWRCNNTKRYVHSKPEALILQIHEGETEMEHRTSHFTQY